MATASPSHAVAPTGNGIRDLPTIASEINAEHAAAERDMNNALGHARRCGELLNEAKAQCPHGSWGAWLRENFRATQQTAAGYMRIASRWSEVGQIESAFSIRDALSALAEPRESVDPYDDEPAPVAATPVSSNGAPVQVKGRGVREDAPDPPGPSRPAAREKKPTEPALTDAGRIAEMEDRLREMAGHLEDEMRTVARLKAENASLRTDDAGTEIRKLSALRAQEQANNLGLQNEIAALREGVRKRDALLNRIRRALKLDRDGDIIATIEALSS